MDKSVNEKLLCEAGQWTKTLFLPYVDNCTDGGFYKGNGKRQGEYISCPFYLGLTDGYIENTDAKLRVMIVGQEARGFGSWKRDSEKEAYKPECSQAWAIEYLQKQLDKNFVSNLKYNKSRFWQLFRALFNTEKYLLCWNNLDKVYFGQDGKKKGTLTSEAETELSKPFSDKGEEEEKSLLQREIVLADPDIILFVTGPDYATSMETAFGVEGKLKGKLNKFNGICEITDIIKCGKKAYWTYHPANRQGIDSAKLFLQNCNL